MSVITIAQPGVLGFPLGGRVKNVIAEKVEKSSALVASRVVTAFAPNDPAANMDAESEVLDRLLHNSLKGVSEGELAPFNYVSVEEPGEPGDWGAKAWAHIDVMRGGKIKSSDRHIVSKAFDEGLMDRLPGKANLFEYGAGGENSVRNNTFCFLDEYVDKHGGQAVHYTNLDLSEDLGAIAPRLVRDRQIPTSSFAADILNDEEATFQDGIPVVLSFGSPFQNAPTYLGRGAPDLCDLITKYMVNMGMRHGPESHFLMPFPVAGDTSALERKYPEDASVSPETERFVLSALRYIADRNVIQNPNYQVLKHWSYFREVVQGYIDIDGDRFVTHKVRSGGRATKAHTLKTMSGPIKVKEGQELVTINSHIPSKALYAFASTAAGYDVKAYKNGMNGDVTEILLHGRFTRNGHMPHI